VLQAIILGIIQGLTEFLPVSSSGHMVIVPYLAGWEQPPLEFNVAVHAATLVAVIVYFARDLWFLATRMFGIFSSGPAETKRARTTVLLLAIGTVPAALAGFFLEDFFAGTFEDPRIAAVMLFVTAALLWGAETIRRRRVAKLTNTPVKDLTPRQARLDPGRDEGTTTFVDAITIGAAQALSILPGISRSGATIAAGMARGLSREGAARFSFLLSIPVIAGAFVFKLGEVTGDVMGASAYGGEALIAGMIAAGLSGYWAIRFLLRLVVNDDLLGFARYVVMFGALTLIGAYTWLGAPSQI
jgi:undecaprenyl-diphosphatase